jgi:hypothetical protein
MAPVAFGADYHVAPSKTQSARKHRPEQMSQDISWACSAGNKVHMNIHELELSSLYSQQHGPTLLLLDTCCVPRPTLRARWPGTRTRSMTLLQSLAAGRSDPVLYNTRAAVPQAGGSTDEIQNVMATSALGTTQHWCRRSRCQAASTFRPCHLK